MIVLQETEEQAPVYEIEHALSKHKHMPVQLTYLVYYYCCPPIDGLQGRPVLTSLPRQIRILPR